MDNSLKQGGRELIHGLKTGTATAPLITIITSTFNAAKDLSWTINSIKAQNYPNIQWIVADGGSTDGTVELLQQNEDIIDYWFSAPDKGIYDAWTKALKHASGEWIQFIGAGDELAGPEVITKVAQQLADAHPQYELAYGNIEIISEGLRQHIEYIGEPWETLGIKWQGIRPALPIHPEVFHHKTIFQRITFNQYKIAGDSYIVLSSILRKEPLYINLLIDRMPHGGISTNPKNILLTYQELKKINKSLGIRPPKVSAFTFLVRSLLKAFILKNFPSAFNIIGDLYRILTLRKVKWTKK
ncbi:glycosyltransferase family 2 protein [Pokkaliibacter sp. CJK22405]|uniref:glycosyltransferase family 2 protein n=1 Tax=Pokkaliibacter sp. CJK22405 TaxID=3384615 RepID=UPI00398536D3